MPRGGRPCQLAALLLTFVRTHFVMLKVLGLAATQKNGRQRLIPEISVMFPLKPRRCRDILPFFKRQSFNMARDDLPDSNIPSFAASRDEGVSSAPRDAVPGRSNRPTAASAGMGLLARLVLTIALVVAAVSCAWAWQLQQLLDKSVSDGAVVAGRVADLEALLSDTDESVEKSAAALGAQLNVVDKETRRLEQRRREMDNKVAKLEKASAVIQTDVGKLQTLVSGQGKSVAAMNTDLTSLSADMTALKRVAGDLERLSKTAMDAQANLERLADNVNKANLDRAAMKQRVTSNEEWIESINAFRRQVNASISRLEDQLRNSQPAISTGSPIPGTP